MAHTLRVESFSPSLLTDVEGFSCGNEPWQIEVAQWIQDTAGSDCALRSMEERGTEVWLYRTPEGELVGYGSLGMTKWKWPAPNGPRETVSIIPYVGVQSKFHGEPKGASPNERYAYQIMGDLISKARRRGTKILGLFVDKKNARATAFYTRVGFQSLPDDDGQYARMFLDLG
jgi:ribosomal protein S18 acetylase RimI-like enzyme